MIYFIGDVYLDKKYSVDIKLQNFIFNLEYPICQAQNPAKNKINLFQKKSFIKETFNDQNPLAVCLSNNHIMDYGNKGFNQTISFLDKEQIKYFGAGNKNNNYNNPCIIDLNQKKIAILGYCCHSTNPIFGNDDTNGAAPLDIDLIIKDVNKSKIIADYIIIQLHWGDEEIKYPKYSDISKARSLIDSGADLIIGHHAHRIQTHEIYKKKSIYYGIGNFIFPNLNVPSYYNGRLFLKRYIKKQSESNKKSLLIKVDIDVKGEIVVDHDTVYFNGESVKIRKAFIPNWLPSNDKMYELYRRLYIKKIQIVNFAKRPRIPTFKNIKYFLFGD
tara:strand:- start:1802 stop:2791 length:990 start_codon:yes stop_codon:yes gene_type:complete